MKTIFFLLFGICTLRASMPSVAEAGIFNLQEFVDDHNWAIGLEPEVTLTDGGGAAANVKFTYGVTPLSNAQFTFGDGSGARKFRIGGAYTFDFIPDIEGQLGAGLAFQAFLYRLNAQITQAEFSVSPYVHKSFKTESSLILDPFLALPLGMAFVSGTYRSTIQLAGGVFYKASEHVGYTTELGISLKDTDSYLAIGVSYRH